MASAPEGAFPQARLDMGLHQRLQSMALADAAPLATADQEADHRIANHLAMLAGLAQLEATKLRQGPEAYSRGEVVQILERLRAQVLATADLHRALALRPGQNIRLSEHLRRVTGIIAMACAGRVLLHQELADDCAVSPEAVLPLGQIVSEAMTNAIKHAKPDGGLVRLTVRCSRDALNTICVEVADDGCGLAPDAATSDSLGLRLIRQLARKAGGAAEFYSGKEGKRVLVRLPDRNLSTCYVI